MPARSRARAERPRVASGVPAPADEFRAAFIEAALWHGSPIRAEAILAAYPEIAGCDIHRAAILGDDAAVRRFLALDARSATLTSDPYGGNALVYLCLSRYSRLDTTRSPAFLCAATALLDAGADPNAGFWIKGEHPELETPRYGAAGVEHHAGLTRLLLERGAKPQRRSPHSVEALLRAGAPARDIAVPSGYPEVDALLRRYGKTA